MMARKGIDNLNQGDEDRRASRWPCAIVFLLIGAAVFAAFWPALSHQFVDWDDTDNFLRNPHYRGLAWENISWMFSTFHMGHFQPLTWMTLGLDAEIASRFYGDALDPRPYHFTNNLLHALNAGLVFLIAVRLLNPSRDSGWPVISGAAAAAVFFGIHPLRVESVAWATERRDLLSAFFLFLCVLAYLRAVSTRTIPSRLPADHAMDRARLGWLFTAFVLFVLSLMSKVMGVTLPVVLLLLDWYPLKRLPYSPWKWFARGSRHVLIEKIPFFAATVVFSLVASIGQGTNQWLVTLEMHSLGARCVQALYGLVFYAWKTLFPVDLLPFYEMLFPLDTSQPRFIVCGVIVLLVVGGVVYLFVARKLPAVVTAVCVYAVMLTPVLGFLQNGQQIVADRYSYLPCIGLAMLAGALLMNTMRSGHKLVATGLAGAYIITFAALAVLTWRQTLIWRSTETLWTYMGAKDPGNSRARNGYGFVLMQAGRLDEAIEQLRQAIRILPTNNKAHENLWIALRRKQDWQGLEKALEEALIIPSMAPRAFYELGSLDLAQNRAERAVERLRIAIALDPSNVRAHVDYGVALDRTGRPDQGLKQYEIAVALDPDFFQARYNLAQALRRSGKSAEALEHMRVAVQLNPAHQRARDTLRDLEATQP